MMASSDSDVAPLIDQGDVPEETGAIGVTGVGHEHFKRTITIPKFVFLAFFLTCGGAIGIEGIVGAAGPLLSFAGLILMPVIFGLPQALLSSELSSMMDENGGTILWVTRAFGPFLGWMNGYNNVCCYLVDLSLYPVLFIDSAFSPGNYSEEWRLAIKLSMIIAITVVNIIGIDGVFWTSCVMCVIVTGPFFVELFIELPRLNPQDWVGVPAIDTIDWGLYLSTLLWSFTGWDSMGTMAGEVDNPGRTYPIGVAIALFINSLVFVIPVAVGLSVDPDYHNWRDGYFVDLGYQMAHWIGVTVLIASVVSNVGQYNACMASYSRAMWAMATGRTASERQLFSIFSWETPRFKTPIMTILLHSGVSAVLASVLNFSQLVRLDTFFNCITLLLEFSAFVWLRYKEPDAPRPYKVPGGMIGCWAITVPMTIAVCLTLAVSNLSTVVVGVVLNVIIAVVYVGQWLKHVSDGGGSCTCGGENESDDNLLIDVVSWSDADDDDDDDLARPSALYSDNYLVSVRRH
eukprot:TRINITY_DN1967_c1_g1_i3.p1 TRINITY_DN1967_c1_g1~~TRINITY_DN1967_c1_g1_i3.p1  ORF type:complete len:517 (+),score=23.83 TRINITY_DN1967_c1_g1_i3:310-1860(+)